MQSLSDFELQTKPDPIVSIWKAIMAMDVIELYSLLDDKIDYENIGKGQFVEKIHKTLETFKSLGDNELYLNFSYCNSCVNNCPVVVFIGNKSWRCFSLRFETENNKIIDIYHCNWFGDEPYF